MKKLTLIKKDYKHFGKAFLCLAVLAFMIFVHFSHTGISLQTVQALTVAPTEDSTSVNPDQSLDQPVDNSPSQSPSDIGVQSSTDQADQTVVDNSQNSDTTTSDDTAPANSNNSQQTSNNVQVTANSVSGTLTISGSSAFEIDWISQNATNCNLLMDGVKLSSVPSNGSMGPIDSTHPDYPAANASHTFTIQCEGLSGSVQGSVIVTRTDTTGPTQTLHDPLVSGTTGTTCGGTIDLTWNTVSGATSYIIFRDNTQIAQVSGLNFTDSGLDAGSSHTYIVKAANGTTTSAGANQIVVNASGACNGAPQSSSSVDITASNSQGPLTVNGEAFTVDWISQNSTNCTVSSDNFSSSVPSNGTLGVIDSTHSYYPTASSSRTFTINCEGLNGPVQDSVVVIRPGTGAPTPIPLDAPVLHGATGTACGGTIDLTWNTVSGATSYIIFRDNTQIAQVSGNTYTDSGLPTNESHSYTVKAVNATTESAFSNTATAASSAACNNGGGPVQTSSVDITANNSQGPLILTQGEAFTVDWVSQNATNCTVSSTNLFSTSVASQGSLGTITPNHPYYPAAGSSRVFTIVCEGLQGQISDSVTVTAPQIVVPPNVPLAPVIFVSTGNQCGGSIFITWNAVSNATAYNVYRGSTLVSSSNNLSFIDTGLTSGLTYTYTVIATNAAGSSTPSNAASAVASNLCSTGNPDVTVTLVANPQTITLNGTSTLTWNSTNATSCSAAFTTSTSTFGMQIVSPATTTTYSIMCSNATKSNTATTTVTVVPPLPPACTIPVIDSGLAANGTVGSTFSYTLFATNASTTSTYSIGTSTLPAGLSITNNTISGTPTTAGTYHITIVAHNTCGTDTETLTITVAPQNNGGGTPIVTVSLTANPAAISQGQNSTLTWTSMNATSCSAAFTAATSTSGTALVNPATTTAYMITCSNGTQAASATTTVTVNTNNGGGTPQITVTLTANPGTIAPGATSTLAWASVSATECSADWTTSTSTSGSQDVAPGSTTDYAIHCTNGSLTGSATTTVTVSTNNGGGGCGDSCNTNSGGGSSSGGGCGATCNSFTPGVSSGFGGGGGSVPMVLGATTVCDYLHDYLHIGWANDPAEVIKLQVFLRDLEGYKNVPLSGNFDQTTFDAVSQFQVQYQPDILTPWGYAQGESTGYVYILTKKKINEIVCQREYPLNAQQEAEIAQFRAFMLDLQSRGVSIANYTGAGTISGVDAGSVVTGSSTAMNGVSASTTATTSVAGSLGHNLAEVASAIFSGPQNFGALIIAILLLLALIIASYAFSRMMIEDEKYKDLPKNEKRLDTILFFIGALIVGLVLCFIFEYYVIVLPILFLVIIMAIVVLVFSVNKTETVIAPTTETIISEKPAATPASMVETPAKSVETPIILAGKTDETEETDRYGKK